MSARLTRQVAHTQGQPRSSTFRYLWGTMALLALTIIVFLGIAEYALRIVTL